MSTSGQGISIVNLEEREYKMLSNFINEHFGIKLPPHKKSLLQNRLQKRLRTLGFIHFKDYVAFVLSHDGKEEISRMIDAVSTNKTEFFREKDHFDYLLKDGLNDCMQRTGKTNISVWSAGCSSGEEPYTLAMVFNEYASLHAGFSFHILATDISERVLQQASEGIYDESKAHPIPIEYKKKYFLKGINTFSGKIRVVPELRSSIDFNKYNLLTSDFSVLGSFDIIFCRNVLIYFEKAIQMQLVENFVKVLNPGGILFLGHSESVNVNNMPLERLRPTIYIRK